MDSYPGEGNPEAPIFEGFDIVDEVEKAESTDGHEEHSGSEHSEPPAWSLAKRLVVASRTAVFCVIMLSALIVSSVARGLLKKDEWADFQLQFTVHADEVQKIATANVLNTIEAIHQLSILYTTLGKSQNEVLPFATIDDFEAFGSEIRTLSRTKTIIFLPLLTSTRDLARWSEYSQANVGWITRSRIFESDEQYDGHSNFTDDTAISPSVYQFDDGATVVDPASIILPASPVWQMYVHSVLGRQRMKQLTSRRARTPIPKSNAVLNKNLANDVLFQKLRDFSKYTHMPVMSDELEVDLGDANIAHSTSLLYPVVDRFKQDGSPSVVGHLLAFLTWEQYLSDILPEGEVVQVVIENCGQNTTWNVEGSAAEFVGYGDLHRGRIDDVFSKRTLVAASESNITAYSDVVCGHTIYIFPTDEAKVAFQDGTATLYPVVIAIIFVFTGSVFCGYDILVSHRQSQTETAANRTGAIVKELFPGNVAAQLFQQDDNDILNPNEVGSSVSRNRTIAELHPSASVLFADISGFTAWSSVREPHQVFSLLEAVFQSFDILAKRYGVFKVETIGDCYVASSGVTKKNAKHAVSLSRFARDALHKFNNLVSGELASTLGWDTADLGMRFGIHSGPVTSGTCIVGESILNMNLH